MMRKTILIYGKVRKTSGKETKDQFLSLAGKFPTDTAILLPTALSEPEAKWDDSVRSDINKLMQSQELHLLQGWQGHKRSEIIRNIAIAIPSIEVHYH